MSSNTKSYDTNLVILRNAFAFSNATIPVSTNYQLVISGPNGYAQFQDSMKILSNYPGVGYLPAEFSTFSGQLAELSTLNVTIASKYVTSSQLASTTQTLLGEIYSTPTAFAASASTVQGAAISTAGIFSKFYVSGVISTVDMYSTQTNLMSTVTGFNQANLAALSNYSVGYVSTTASVLREYGTISANLFGLSNYNAQQYSTLSTLLGQEPPRQSTLDGALKVSNEALSNRYQTLVQDYVGVSTYYDAYPPPAVQLSSFSTLVGSQFNIQAATLAALTQDISALSYAFFTETTTKTQLSSLSATYAYYQGVLPTEDTVSTLSIQIGGQIASVTWLSSYIDSYIPPQSALIAIQAATDTLSAPFTVAEFSTLSTTLGIENRAISSFAGTTLSTYAPNSITPQHTFLALGINRNLNFKGNDASDATVIPYPNYPDNLPSQYQVTHAHSSDRILLIYRIMNGTPTTYQLYYYEGSMPLRDLSSSTVLPAGGFFTGPLADLDYGYINQTPTWVAGSRIGALKQSSDGKVWTDISAVTDQPSTPKCILAPKLNNTQWYIVDQTTSPQLYTTQDFITYSFEPISNLSSKIVTAADAFGDTVVVGTSLGRLYVRESPGVWTQIILPITNYFNSINTIKYITEKGIWVVSGTRSAPQTVIFWSYDAITWYESGTFSAKLSKPVVITWTGVQWLVATGDKFWISNDLIVWRNGPVITLSIDRAETNRCLTTFNYKPPTPAELCLSTYTNNISTLYGDYTLNNISSGHISSLSTSFGEVPVKGDLNQGQLTSTVRGIYDNPKMTAPLTVSSQMAVVSGQQQPLNITWDQGIEINVPSLTLTSPLVALPNMNVYKQQMYVGQGQTQMSFAMGASAPWQTGTSTIRGCVGLKGSGSTDKQKDFYALRSPDLLKSVDGILWQQVDLSASRGFQALTALETDISQGVVIAGRKSGGATFAQSLDDARTWRDISFRVASGVKPLAEISVLEYNSKQLLWVAGGTDTSGTPALFWTTDISAGTWTRSATAPPGRPTFLINKQTAPSASTTVWLVCTDQTATPTQTSTYFSLDGKIWQVCTDAYIKPTSIAVSQSLWVASGHVLLKNTGQQFISGFAYSFDGRNWQAAATGTETVRGLCVEYVEATDTWIGFAEDAVYLGTYYFMQSSDGINWSRGQRVPEPITRVVESAYASKVSIYDTLRVAGNLVKATGYFEIEHPLDPVQGLRHSFVEGPTRGDNMYRFTVTTDDAASAMVDLPAYYPYLNEQPMIWLTAVGGQAKAFATYDAAKNAVLINSDHPQVTLNVLVMGTRKDEAAKQAFDARGGAEFMRYPETQ